MLVCLLRVDFARAPHGFFAAEVFLEIRQVEGTYLVLCAAWPIHCQGVPDSVPSSLSFQIEMKSLTLLD